MDFRGVKRVILWMEPRTFNSLIQKIGRCVRIFSELGEAIVFITKAALKRFTIEFDIGSVEKGVDDEGDEHEEESEPQREDEPEVEVEDDGSESSEDELDQDVALVR